MKDNDGAVTLDALKIMTKACDMDQIKAESCGLNAANYNKHGKEVTRAQCEQGRVWSPVEARIRRKQSGAPNATPGSFR